MSKDLLKTEKDWNRLLDIVIDEINKLEVLVKSKSKSMDLNWDHFKKRVTERFVDRASLAIVKNGGIDLTPANMHLQTQNNGGEIKFHLDSAMLAQLRNAPGFVPVIINIQPLKSLQQFMGINQDA